MTWESARIPLSSCPVTATVRRLRAARWPAAVGILAGAAADALAGDPRRGHPVALFGRAAQAAQDRVYADSLLRGAGYAAGCVLAVAGPAAVVQQLTRGRPWARAAATAAVVWAATGARSLTAEAERMSAALESGDVTAARAILPGLCGRDPAGLDEAELARATVESVAENTSDAVVAPLVWAVLAGLPGLAGYRALNTLDAMVGYRSPRYARFGWASARLDDVANWAAACSPVVGGRPAATWRAMRRYGGRHPSPNAGRCEAAFAGALGVRLGGTNVYAGATEHRPVLGQGRATRPDDIRRAVRLCRAVTIASTVAAAAAAAIGG
jgi:adenosylcobinamide-phosphate synthase